MAAFNETCPRSVRVADFTQCDSDAWREVGVAQSLTSQLYCGETTDGQPCIFQGALAAQTLTAAIGGMNLAEANKKLKQDKSI